MTALEKKGGRERERGRQKINHKFQGHLKALQPWTEYSALESDCQGLNLCSRTY